MCACGIVCLPCFRPGALQVRGENLLPLLLGLAKSPELMTRTERRMARWSEPEREAHHLQNGNSSLWVNGRYATGAPAGEEETVFFDVFYRYMVRLPASPPFASGRVRVATSV